MPNPPPFPIPGPTPPPRQQGGTTTSVVGAVPWQQPAAPRPDMPPAVVPPVLEAAPPTPRIDPRGHWLTNYIGEEEVAAVLAWQAQLKETVRSWVRESPALTLSLAAHLVVLLLLALWVVRGERRPPPIEVRFDTLSVVQSPNPGDVTNEVVEVKPPQPEPPPKAEAKPEPTPPPKPEPTPEPTPTPASPEPAAEPAGSAIANLLDGRGEKSQQRLVQAHGGSDVTQAAVARALDWIVRQQGKEDGLWSLQGPYLDGGSQENRLAATAMALLALQGAGNTTTEGKHSAAVARGWKGLLAAQLRDGRFDLPVPTHHSLYSHAQATIALCEIYGMTHDESFAAPARRAIAYAVAAQGPNGAWRYEPGKPGDMSVTGWYMMALKTAQAAGVDFPTQTLANLGRFVDSVAVDGGKRYGYRFEGDRPPDPDDPEAMNRKAGPVTDAVSAEGLLCRQYLGCKRDDPRVVGGLELLLAAVPLDYENSKDVYAWYYITQVAHHFGGEPWDRWNARLKEVVPAKQVSRGAERGSWDPALDKWGPWGGRLYMTCFCTFMLEVYYRHQPLYDADGGPAN